MRRRSAARSATRMKRGNVVRRLVVSKQSPPRERRARNGPALLPDARHPKRDGPCETRPAARITDLPAPPHIEVQSESRGMHPDDSRDRIVVQRVQAIVARDAPKISPSIPRGAVDHVRHECSGQIDGLVARLDEAEAELLFFTVEFERLAVPGQ